MKRFNLPIVHNPLRTRVDMQQALVQLCDPLKPFYSKGCARLHVGNTSASYSDSIAEMEGFTRVLWGLAPSAAGGMEYDLWDTYLEGIKNGTNPAHEEYWGEVHDYDQRLVEMAAYGFALALVPEKIWLPLNEEEKNNFATWLNQVNYRKVYDVNWLFFPVMVNMGFKKVGIPYDSEKINENLDRINDFYLTDGWYSDGIGGHCDYYNPFVFHYYGLLYATLMESEDPERSSLYKSRAEIFAKDYIYWFARDGSALPYGRSLAYRFAQAAYWSALAFAGVEPFPMGVIKGLVLRNLRWWFDQPIFSPDGLITIGYSYPNLIMAENYNAPGSTYWAFTALLPLALKEDHPFWRSEELPLPPLDSMSVQLPPHLVICRQEDKNHVLAFNSGHPSTNEHTHASAKYEKFVYSNFFCFSVPRAEWGVQQGAFDSMLALSEGDNIYRVKRTSEEYKIQDDLIYTRWKPWSDVEVETWLVAGAPWHLRVHSIRTERYLESAEGGFALAIEPIDFKESAIEIVQNRDGVLAGFPWGATGIIRLYGNGKSELVYPNANTNLMNSRTVIPTVRASIHPGIHWYITAVFGDPASKTTWKDWDNAPYADILNNMIIVHLNASTRIGVVPAKLIPPAK